MRISRCVVCSVTVINGTPGCNLQGLLPMILQSESALRTCMWRLINVWALIIPGLSECVQGENLISYESGSRFIGVSAGLSVLYCSGLLFYF
ncbi:MAG: hypothetical protein ACYC2P_00615 [Paludibacteraceae bacterium]